jgi:hypothetical protein
MKLEQLANNQFIIRTDNEVFFQSYDKVVLKIDIKGNVYLTHFWNYSKTTSKFVTKVLGLSSKDIKKRLDLNVYTLVKEINL